MSRFGAVKVRLFKFTHQGYVWRYAQAKQNVTADSQTWTAAPIERDNIRLTAEPAKDKLNIRIGYLRDPLAPLAEIPATQSLGDLWTPFIPTDAVDVECYEYTQGSADPPKRQWVGHVVQPAFNDVQLELTCMPGSAKARAADQGPRVQRTCFKTVYGTGIRGCNLLRAAFETTATVTVAADGITLTAAAFGGQAITLLGGGAEWTDTRGWVHRRMITSYSGSSVKLHFAGPDLATGASVTVYPNCPGTWEACAARRADPQNHFGGAAYLPVENPMSDGISMTW